MPSKEVLDRMYRTLRAQEAALRAENLKLLNAIRDHYGFMSLGTGAMFLTEKSEKRYGFS